MPKAILTSALEICGTDLPENVITELENHDKFLDEDGVIVRKNHLDQQEWPACIDYLKSQNLWLGSYQIIVFSSNEHL